MNIDKVFGWTLAIMIAIVVTVLSFIAFMMVSLLAHFGVI